MGAIATDSRAKGEAGQYTLCLALATPLQRRVRLSTADPASRGYTWGNAQSRPMVVCDRVWGVRGRHGNAARADAGDVTLTLRDGRATIVARNASLQQILREWALRGATRFVNLERVANTPISLEVKDMPERQALAILLVRSPATSLHRAPCSTGRRRSTTGF